MSSQDSLGNQKEMELTQSIEPEQKTDIKVEDYTEVLPDGVTHTVHKERRRSLQTIHYTWKSQDGEEHTKDEVQEVPGSLVEDVVETFEEPPVLMQDVEEVDQVLPDGSVVHQEVIHQRMVHKVTTHQVSFDSEHSILKEDSYAVDEVVPGTETAFLKGGDTDSEEDYSDESSDLEIVEDMMARSSVGDEGQDDSRDSGAAGVDEDVETHRLMMKKEVHKKTTIGPDGKESTTVHEDSQIQQENDPPEELRESMQEIINQFMETDPQPAQLPEAPQQSKEEEV